MWQQCREGTKQAYMYMCNVHVYFWLTFFTNFFLSKSTTSACKGKLTFTTQSCTCTCAQVSQSLHSSEYSGHSLPQHFVYVLVYINREFPRQVGARATARDVGICVITGNSPCGIPREVCWVQTNPLQPVCTVANLPTKLMQTFASHSLHHSCTVTHVITS